MIKRYLLFPQSNPDWGLQYEMEGEIFLLSSSRTYQTLSTKQGVVLRRGLQPETYTLVELGKRPKEIEYFDPFYNYNLDNLPGLLARGAWPNAKHAYFSNRTYKGSYYLELSQRRRNCSLARISTLPLGGDDWVYCKKIK
jgi:hypothetical protein